MSTDPSRTDKGILSYLRDHANDPKPPESMTQFEREGLVFMKQIAATIRKATTNAPTVWFRGVCVVKSGVWQDCPEAEEFRKRLKGLIQ